MSQIQLVVREAQKDWSGIVAAGVADCAIVALSADPATLADLEAAMGRYAKPPRNGRLMASLSVGLIDEPFDAGLVVIDLVARFVAMNSTYSSFTHEGEIAYHDGKCQTETLLPYHLADDWHFAYDRDDWEGLADQRRRENATRPHVDVRSVIYGRPLLEFVGRETFARFERLDTATIDIDEARVVVKSIHADWLMTPRDEFGGRCPREVTVESREHIVWDLQDQSERWSLLNEAPPGLQPTALAFQFAGFGTHELVLYYDLVRELLWSCFDQFNLQRAETKSLSVGDFLTAEVPLLEVVRDEWLNAPQAEHHGRTARSMIDRERARLPEGMSAREAVVDSDCPCCQMMADMPGPMFWGLDGCNMDDEFAFDFHCRTREDWEAKQKEWEDFNRRFDAEQAERKRLGVTDRGGPGEKIWTSSFWVNDGPEVPLGIRLFGIGCRLAELVSDIRGGGKESAVSPEGQQWIDQLNRDFGNMREVLQGSTDSVAMALIDPVIDRFVESLDGVGSAYPDSAAKCESLAESLRKFMEPASENESAYGGEDIPF